MMILSHLEHSDANGIASFIGMARAHRSVKRILYAFTSLQGDAYLKNSFSDHKYLTIYIQHCSALHMSSRLSLILCFSCSVEDFPGHQTIGKLSTKQIGPM